MKPFPLYHRSPSSRRKQIERQGLRGGNPAVFERLGDWPSMSPDAKSQYVSDLKRRAADAKARFGLYNFRPR